jgi:hypothetical protein
MQTTQVEAQTASRDFLNDIAFCDHEISRLNAEIKNLETQKKKAIDYCLSNDIRSNSQYIMTSRSRTTKTINPIKFVDICGLDILEFLTVPMALAKANISGDCIDSISTSKTTKYYSVDYINKDE